MKKVSDKNKLVKLWWEHQNIDQVQNVLNKKNHGSGIYVLYHGGEIYYIGLSKNNLRRRLSRHALKDKHIGQWDSFSFYQIRRPKHVKDVESLLLRIFKPTGNSISGRFHKKFNYQNHIK